MKTIIFSILISQLFCYRYCFYISLGQNNENNTEVKENLVLFNALRLTSLKHPKKNSCGLKYGGALVQLVTAKYIYVNGLNWYDTEQCLIFADRFNATINCFHKDIGQTVNYYIKELENMEVAAVFGVKGHLNKFAIAANQSIYLLTNMIKNLNWAYSFEELMKVTDDSKILTEAVVTQQSHILIGTKPSNYKENYPDIQNGESEFLVVDLENKKVDIIDDNFTMTSGVAIDYEGKYTFHADVIENKIWRRKIEANSELELIFDMDEYRDTITGQVTSITLDKEGKLWIAFWNSYQIVQFDIDNKQIIQQIPITAPMVNSLSWGGLWYETLYAGTTIKNVDTRAVPAAGTVIGISGTGSRGWRQNKVAIARDWLK